MDERMPPRRPVLDPDGTAGANSAVPITSPIATRTKRSSGELSWSTSPNQKTSEGDRGASGHGPIDGDGGGRRPDRGGNDASRLLIVLGIIAVGAGVISARLLAKAGQRRASRSGQ